MHREAVGTASTRERRPKISAPISGGEYVAEEIATAATTAQAAKNIPTTKRPTVIGLVISPMPIAFTAFAMQTTRDECLGNDAAPVRSRNSAFSPRPLSKRQAGTPTNPEGRLPGAAGLFQGQRRSAEGADPDRAFPFGGARLRLEPFALTSARNCFPMPIIVPASACDQPRRANALLHHADSATTQQSCDQPERQQGLRLPYFTCFTSRSATERGFDVDEILQVRPCSSGSGRRYSAEFRGHACPV